MSSTMTTPPRADTGPIAKVFAAIGLVLSLLFPLALVAQDIGVTIYIIQTHPRPFPWLAYFYSAVDYFGLPVVLAGLLVSSLVVRFTRGQWRTTARTGVIISVASLAFYALVILLLGLVALSQR